MEYTRLSIQYPSGDLPVNVFRVGDVMIDSGHMHNDSRRQVVESLSSGDLQSIRHVIITHPHTDHVGGSMTNSRIAQHPHVVPKGVKQILSNYEQVIETQRDKIRSLSKNEGTELDGFIDRVLPLDFDYDGNRINIKNTVSDNSRVTAGRYDLTTIETPGHCIPHISLFHSKSGTLFSGDLIFPHGHFVWGSIDNDIGMYIQSLENVAGLEPSVIVPSHGPPIEDPEATITDCINKVNKMSQSVLSEITGADEEISADEVARNIFNRSGDSHRYMTLAISSYFRHLSDENKIILQNNAEGLTAQNV